MNTLRRNDASSLFFFKAQIRSRSLLLNEVLDDFSSFSYSDVQVQVAKFEKSKKHRLSIELGYGSQSEMHG
ncbi:hypothetical protein Ccrd_021436 [Cynara cardunculus var. scolymus]|uniref:Uncharacterized protein n=1 Tax=Cynara cardunculus var. scolymus TaxID=59895 RepID=A0A103Y0K8_CYNCS|nr:hypothetical protein Ccrd_021436 [Cynara cardunculus var. scolymus]